MVVVVGLLSVPSEAVVVLPFSDNMESYAQDDALGVPLGDPGDWTQTPWLHGGPWPLLDIVAGGAGGSANAAGSLGDGWHASEIQLNISSGQVEVGFDVYGGGRLHTAIQGDEVNGYNNFIGLVIGPHNYPNGIWGWNRGPDADSGGLNDAVGAPDDGVRPPDADTWGRIVTTIDLDNKTGGLSTWMQGRYDAAGNFLENPELIYTGDVPFTTLTNVGLAIQNGGPGYDNVYVTTPGSSASFAGDFDSDGDVDGDDFLAWQNGFPISTGAALLDGDADADGDVDGDDFLIWQNSFPYPTAISSVPEPNSLVLLALGATGVLAHRRRRIRLGRYRSRMSTCRGAYR